MNALLAYIGHPFVTMWVEVERELILSILISELILKISWRRLSIV